MVLSKFFSPCSVGRDLEIISLSCNTFLAQLSNNKSVRLIATNISGTYFTLVLVTRFIALYYIIGISLLVLLIVLLKRGPILLHCMIFLTDK